MTTPHPLDNPVWASLTSCHAGFAHKAGLAARYPPAAAPFVAVGASNAEAGADAASLVAVGESVCFVGLAPPLPASWRIDQSVTIAQMICESRLPGVGGPDIIELTQTHLDDMLALTALVYPHYFRLRTREMGRYVGIYDGDTLAAMAGERMHFNGYCEISAVCTHPDYAGRGYARRLIALLANDILERRELPFLHFSQENVRAKALYERMGFSFRTNVPLLAVTRTGD